MFAAAIPFPDIGPEIFSVQIGDFTLALRWYALAYIVGILIGWRLVVRALRTDRLWPSNKPPMTPAQLEDLLTWIIIGVIIGGRLGFVLFYQPRYYLSHPADILMVWQGGMSFHGGFLGVVIAVWWFCRRNGLPTAQIADAMAFAAPPGLLLGRMANFVNAELWGRPSTVPWAVIFPGDEAQYCPGFLGDLCARHPSQLYEAGLEGVMLGALLLFLVWRRDWLKMPGQIAGLFLVGYGLSRFTVEFFRQADAQFVTPENPFGYIVQAGGFGFTMGQLFSLPMILIGLVAIHRARRPL
jgi:phosphatidylglycerol:prolipoprotein diacylglycerol transferase